MNPATRVNKPYLISIIAITLIALGIDRYLVFWEWSFLGHWLHYRKFLIVALYTFVSIGTLHLFMIRNAFLRVLGFAYTWLTLTYVGVYIVLEDRNPSTDDGFIMVDGLNEFMIMGVAAIRAYGKAIAIALLASGVVTLQLSILGDKAAKAPGKRLPHWVAAALYLLAFGYCYGTFEEPGDQTPLYAKTAAVVAKTMVKSNKLYNGPRAAPRLVAHPSAKSKSHILFIMDESIAGYALGINGCKYDTTPFLNTLSSPDFVNYGVACSGGNFSVLSNLVITSGIRVDQLPDTEQVSMRQASVFGYAKAAGRKTWYIDAQNPKLMNQMKMRDLADFTFIPLLNLIDNYEDYALDRQGLRKAAEIIREASEPTLVFLLKTGAHVVFSGKFPPEMSGEGLRAKNDRARDYLKAVKWAVDDFCAELLEELRGKDVIVVYTSDHGVNVDFEAQSHSPGLFYATRGAPSMREASVPLFIWMLSEQARLEYQSAGGFAVENFNAASHYQVFPTLLRLMGYDKADVKREYGNSLFDPPYSPRRFASYFFVGNTSEEDAGALLHEYVPLPESAFGAGEEE